MQRRAKRKKLIELDAHMDNNMRIMSTNLTIRIFARRQVSHQMEEFVIYDEYQKSLFYNQHGDKKAMSGTTKKRINSVKT